MIVSAHRINAGRMDKFEAVEGSDFVFAEAAHPEEGAGSCWPWSGAES